MSKEIELLSYSIHAEQEHTRRYDDVKCRIEMPRFLHPIVWKLKQALSLSFMVKLKILN